MEHVSTRGPKKYRVSRVVTKKKFECSVAMTPMNVNARRMAEYLLGGGRGKDVI